MLGNSSR